MTNHHSKQGGLNLIDLIPDMIRYKARGQYWNGKKWSKENCMFTEILTDNRNGTTTARAYESLTTYYGETDGWSGMPSQSDTHKYDRCKFESKSAHEAISSLYDWLVNHKYINKNGKPTKIVHLTQEED